MQRGISQSGSPAGVKREGRTWSGTTDRVGGGAYDLIMSSDSSIDDQLARRPWNEVSGPALLRAAGALQLLPQNQVFALELHVLASIAVRIPVRANARPVTASMLRGMLKNPLLKDPEGDGSFVTSDLFCSEIEFVDMPFRMIAGSSDSAHLKAQSLVQAIVKKTGAALPPDFVRYAYKLAMAVFGISEAMCQRAEIERTRPPLRGDEGRIFVPSTVALRLLEHAVHFRFEELPDGVLDLLQPLSTAVGEGIDIYPKEAIEAVGVRPFHLSDDALTISCPGELAGALMCELQRLAGEANCLRALGEAHRRYLARYVAHVASLSELEVEEPIEVGDANVTLVVAHIQGQRIVFAVAADLFDGYAVEEPFGMWLSTDVAEAIGEAIAVEGESPVVVLTIGSTTRGHMGFLPASDTADWIMLDPHNLAMLLKLEWNNDPWELVRFARASSRLGETTQVISHSELGEYGLYKDNYDSFYLDDGELPSALMLAGDYGVSIRTQSRLRLDEHLVPTAQGAITSISMSGIDFAPIYLLMGDSARSLSIEFPHLFVWIRASDSSGPTTQLFLEGIAYWLWQIFAQLPASVPARELRILIGIEPGLGEAISIARQGRAQFGVTVRPDVAFELVPEANEFDRALVKELLVGVAGPFIGQTLDVNRLLEHIAPLGNKKMFLVGSGAIPELYDSGMARHSRLIAKSVASAVLDDLGARLFEELDVHVGDIPDDRTVEVLNHAVAIIYRRLVEMCARFDANSMLTRLIAQSEGLDVSTRLEDIRRLTRIACYGEVHYPAKKLREDTSRRVETSLAVRFLIEYLSAVPSIGSAAPTDDEYDTVCALALEITTMGMLSDARHYGLSEVTVSRLPSGRLGTSQDDRYATGLISHSELSISRELQGEPDPEDDEDEWRFTKEEDAAFTDEFGFTVDEIQTAVGGLYDELIADPHTGVVRTTMAAASAIVAKRAGWTTGRAQELVALFALQQESSFSLSPETAPWRFGRLRSYLRKPIVIGGAGDAAILIWGQARLLGAIFDLVNLYKTGRLKASSKRMKTLLGSVRQAKNYDFEEKVAARFRARGFSDVRKRVRVINGRRLVSATDEDLGDIDVLVVDQSARELLVVEAKDFETARTPIEMSREMFKLRQDAVRKNHRRAEWLRQNLDLFESPSSRQPWVVREIVVTSRRSTAVATGNGHETVIAIHEL